MNMRIDITEQIEMPAGLSASLADGILSIKGPKGELKRKIASPTVHVKVEGQRILVSCVDGTKREKCAVFTAVAHVKNMVKGVQAPYVYELKICSGHFPMNVELKGNVLSVKNFLGEKVPRTLKIKDGVKVAVAGDRISVESIDIELAGVVASDIEHICRITDRDRRIFQDGIYITKKCGEAV